ncbi:MAG: hypothetical protein JWR69_4605 [Pedosphaera sp.]|nr:hypothetical protein [Pedosphaera sp.]
MLAGMISVRSSNLRAVGYDGELLVIEFHGGRVYEYYGVPSATHSGLMRASSHGTYFHRYIRDRYAYRRVA